MKPSRACLRLRIVRQAGHRNGCSRGSRPSASATPAGRWMETSPNPKPLPAGWEAVEDDQGRTYYWNVDTDATTWTRPRVMNVGHTGENCTKCGTQVYVAERMVAGSRIYHADCFRCFTCRTKLGPSSWGVGCCDPATAASSGVAADEEQLFCGPHLEQMKMRTGRTALQR